MARKKKIGLTLALDGEAEFNKAVTNINKNLGVMKSVLTKVSAEYEGNANSAEALRKKQEILNKLLEEQKNKQAAATKGLDNAKEAYKAVSGRLDELKKKLNDAVEAQEAMKKAGDASEDALKSQADQIKELDEAVRKQEGYVQLAENRIKKWEKSLNNADTAVIKATRDVNKNAAYLGEAEEAADGCATSIDKFGKEMQQASKETGEFGDEAQKVSTTLKDKLGQAVATKGVSMAVDALGAAGEKLKEIATESDEAATQLQAAGGLTEELAEKYKDVMESIHADNFGKDYADISEVMGQIVQIMGKLDPTAMKETAESAITLRDTFDMDYNETIRGADTLMKNMGLSAQEAFDFIAKGAQNGLNRSGELVDNLTEYTQLWGQAGFSAEEMFAILDNGLNNGAYNLDKVNDYVKEFTISLSDGRMEENLSSFSEGTQGLFKEWKNGEATAKDVFYSVIGDLSDMTNEQEALTLASTMWSAVGEDNSMKVIRSLDDVNTKYQDVRGTMESLKEVKYSDISSSIEGLGRAIQDKFLAPITDTALPAIKKGIEGITTAIDPPKDQLGQFLEDIKTANEEVKTSLESAGSVMEGGEADTAKLEAYKKTLLDLNDATEKTEFQKYQLKQIITELSGDIPELAAAFDEETGSISLTNDAITDLIDKQEELIEEQAKSKAKENIFSAYFDAKVIKEQAESAKEAADQAVEEIQEKINSLGAGGRLGAMFSGEWSDLQKELRETQTQQMQANEAFEEANKNLERAAELYGTVKDTVSTTAPELERAADGTLEVSMSWEKLSEKQQAAAGAAEETAQVVMGANEEVAESSEEAAEAAKAGADAQREALNSLQDKYEEFRSQLQADIENKISLFEAFDGGEDMTVEKMLENLKSQTEGLENWRDNLKTLADEVGTSITPEFYNAILEMGPEAANAVQHMVDTLDQENGRELLMELAKEYGDAMDFSDEMSDSMARVETVLDTALDMISNAGSSAFDDLASAMDDGVKAIEAEGGSVSQATRDAFLRAVDAAKAVGAEIPEGLAESIASGETSIEEATAQLNGSVKGQLEGLKEAAREAGIEISPEIAAGLEAGGPQALEAIQALIDQFNAKKEELGQAGKDGADQYTQQATASIEEGSGNVSSAAQDVGTQIMESAADGVSGSSGTLNDAVTQAMQSALNSALGYQGGFTSAGYFMSSGVATGITQGRSLAINAAVEMARQALAGAKQELEIKSPSRKFKRELGEQIGKGAAWGIKTSTKDAKKSAKEMSKEVLASATEWMEEYQLGHKVSLEDEKYFWQQVKKETKKGTEAYKQASKEISRISQEEKKIQDNFGVSRTETKNKKTVRKSDKEYYSEILQEARTYLDNKKVIYDISLREEEAYWTAVSKQLKRGTQAWYDAQKELKNVREDIKKQAQEAKEAQKEAAQEAREALVSEGETYVSRQRLKGSMDDGQELAYWKNVKSQLKRGTDEWWEVYEKIKDLEGDIAEAEEEARREREEAQQELMDYALSGNALEDYRTYFKVSAQAEIQYWEIVRKKFKQGTEERIEADKKYFEAKEELNEQLKELEEDYADKVKEVNEQMENDIKDLEEAYEDAVKSTADSIRSATGLFDAFESESVDGATLIYNLKTQVIGIRDWREQLQKLKDKGLDQGLIDELTAMGPEISATLHILNNDRVGDMGMTDEQLEEYEELWKQLNELTEDAAKEQNEILRKETEQKIADIQTSAQLELATYKAEYESASAELTETISQPLETLANQMGTWGSEAVANYIAGIETGTENGKAQVSTAVSQISSVFSGTSGAAETAGSNVSKEFASGVTASIGDINTSMGNIRNNVMSTLDQLVANGKTSGKNLGSGLAAGIRSSIKDVKEASKESVDSVISTIKKIGKINSPSKLTEEEAGIYFPAGIGQGIKKNKKAATEPAKDMVRGVLEAAQAEMDKGNMSLKARMENINFSGINRLNALMDTPIQTSITANINNSDLLGIMNQMLVTMQAFMEQEANKQIMLDKDTVVGELQPGISQTSAQKSKKINRGRY